MLSIGCAQALRLLIAPIANGFIATRTARVLHCGTRRSSMSGPPSSAPMQTGPIHIADAMCLQNSAFAAQPLDSHPFIVHMLPLESLNSARGIVANLRNERLSQQVACHLWVSVPVRLAHGSHINSTSAQKAHQLVHQIILEEGNLESCAEFPSLCQMLLVFGLNRAVEEPKEENLQWL